ncbi:GmrSD restriction endonuclease domain-containing protein [Demequina salsinemoris]|uniref:GmrSD restriction endonuclease domain-containing protein n=1 Tax=Demequina salsinemoris TaxID=577470 RepID=UPI000A6FBD92|nr:DUF1524 domain-containing protein [Demequina salsinemoris]
MAAGSANPWWLSWPMIILGFLMCVIPGVVLLLLRKGVSPITKLIVAGVTAALVLLASNLPGDQDDATVADGSASPSVSVTASATASASPSPSETLGEEPTAAASASSTPSSSPEPSTAAAVETEEPEFGTAQDAALELTVKGRAAKTGYSRDQFGSGWIDVDSNGCDTRNDMLRLRLTDKEMSGSCKVLSGTLDDPYTGTAIVFEYGGASEVDIDHMVALSDAWQKGAQKWKFAKRVAFANDPLNLEPVEAAANRQKGDADAATWLPSNKSYRCEYVARQIAVKAKYGVWVTQAEQDAMLDVLESCPDYPLPGPGDQPVVATNLGGQSEPVEETVAEKTMAPAETSDDAVDERYPYCKDLPAGYGPYYEGVDPEYDWYRDGDGDGIVCE